MQGYTMVISKIGAVPAEISNQVLRSFYDSCKVHAASSCVFNSKGTKGSPS